MKISNCNGSSLVEVVVSMFLLGLLVTGINFCVVSLINRNAVSKEISAATALGNQTLEQLRRSDFQDIIAGFEQGSDRFIRSWTVSNTDDDNMKRIDLWVFWPDNQDRSISMSTMVSRSFGQ